MLDELDDELIETKLLFSPEEALDAIALARGGLKVEALNFALTRWEEHQEIPLAIPTCTRAVIMIPTMQSCSENDVDVVQQQTLKRFLGSSLQRSLLYWKQSSHAELRALGWAVNSLLKMNPKLKFTGALVGTLKRVMQAMPVGFLGVACAGLNQYHPNQDHELNGLIIMIVEKLRDSLKSSHTLSDFPGGVSGVMDSLEVVVPVWPRHTKAAFRELRILAERSHREDVCVMFQCVKDFAYRYRGNPTPVVPPWFWTDVEQILFPTIHREPSGQTAGFVQPPPPPPFGWHVGRAPVLPNSGGWNFRPHGLRPPLHGRPFHGPRTGRHDPCQHSWRGAHEPQRSFEPVYGARLNDRTATVSSQDGPQEPKMPERGKEDRPQETPVRADPTDGSARLSLAPPAREAYAESKEATATQSNPEANQDLIGSVTIPSGEENPGPAGEVGEERTNGASVVSLGQRGQKRSSEDKDPVLILAKNPTLSDAKATIGASRQQEKTRSSAQFRQFHGGSAFEILWMMPDSDLHRNPTAGEELFGMTLAEVQVDEDEEHGDEENE